MEAKRKMFGGLVASALVLVLASCQQSTSTSSPPAKSSTAAGQPLQVDEITVAAQGDDSAPSAGLPTGGEPIQISIKTRGDAKTAALVAKLISLKDGSVVATVERTLEVSGPATTQLIFKQDKPLEAGRYLIEITVDGRLVGQRDMDVEPTPEDDAA